MVNDNTTFGVTYADLEAGSNDIVNTVSSINESIDNANRIVTDINNEGTFSGPLADYCLNVWNRVQNITIDHTELLSNSSNTLSNVGSNYEITDTLSSNNILSGIDGTQSNYNIDTVTGNLTMTEIAKAEIGKGYHSLGNGIYGPGWGCAMFVSYVYNQGQFGGQQVFGGSTTDFWSNVISNETTVNQGFVLVDESQAQEGDVVCYMEPGTTNPFSTSWNCNHVGYYLGNGQMIDSAPSGGVQQRNVDAYSYDRYYLHYVG